MAADYANTAATTTATEYDDNKTGIEECPISFMDSSMYYFPSTSTMSRNSNLDFGVICQPLQSCTETETETETEMQLVNFSQGSVIRCRACRAYINPYIEWVSNGMHTHWICNLCGISNDINKIYYENYLSGLCKELQFASIEIVAPDEYCVRPPQFPSYLFIINVNKQLIKSNILNDICHTIKQIINDENTFNDERIQIGFITYSDKIHFYSLQSHLTKPQMIVINDINDALLPIPSNQIMTNLSESHELIDDFLTILPSLHETENECSSCDNALGTALQCGFSTLKQIGGKIVCFSYGLASLGQGKVMNRSVNTNINNANEYDKLLKRSNNFFMDLAISLTKYQISCDLFQFCGCGSFGSEYVDISTIKGICRCSGGELFYYNQYNNVLNSNSFCNDLYKLLTRPQGWESVMRIRVSKGICIKHYYGCFYRRSADLLSIPTIDCDKTVTILLQHNTKTNDNNDNNNNNNNNNIINAPYIYIQSALLYTNNSGQRRIRCCTKRIGVTSSYDELFNNINLSVLTSLIAKQAVFKMLSKDVASSRMFIQDCCIGILQSYCKYCKYCNVENDYPLCIRYLPLNTLGLLKCVAFADIRDVSLWMNSAGIDIRISLLISMLHMNNNNIELLIRPSLYRIDNILLLDEETLNDEYYLPCESPLTLKSISSNGIYLLDNGQSFIIRIGKNVKSDIIQTFIKKNEKNQQNGKQYSFLSLIDDNNNKYIYKLNSILQYLQSINYRHQSIKIISESQNDKNKEFCTIYLIRDRTESVMSYDEFFTFIYKQTKPKLTSNNKIR